MLRASPGAGLAPVPPGARSVISGPGWPSITCLPRSRPPAFLPVRLSWCRWCLQCRRIGPAAMDAGRPVPGPGALSTEAGRSLQDPAGLFGDPEPVGESREQADATGDHVQIRLAGVPGDCHFGAEKPGRAGADNDLVGVIRPRFAGGIPVHPSPRQDVVPVPEPLTEYLADLFGRDIGPWDGDGGHLRLPSRYRYRLADRFAPSSAMRSAMRQASARADGLSSARWLGSACQRYEHIRCRYEKRRRSHTAGQPTGLMRRRCLLL